MIKIEDVFVVFFPGTNLERVALRGVNLSIKDGEVISILGNNGSGRSTLLKLLAGHMKLTFGRIIIDKIDATHHSISQRSMICSSIFYEENTGVAGNLTVAENMALANMHHQKHSIFSPAISFEMRDLYRSQLKKINFMGLDQLIDEKVANLSQSHRHVLSMVVAVIKGSKIMLIDEHSTGLDRDSSKKLLKATEMIIKDKKITTIMAINDPEFAMKISDRIIIMSHGQIVADLNLNARKNITLDQIYSSYSIIPEIKDNFSKNIV